MSTETNSNQDRQAKRSLGYGAASLSAGFGFGALGMLIPSPSIIVGFLFAFSAAGFFVISVFELSSSPRNRTLATVATIVLMAALLGWWNSVPAPLEAISKYVGGHYDSKLRIGDFDWNPQEGDLRLDVINPADHDCDNLDLIVRTDLAIRNAGQISRIQNVNIFPNAPAPLGLAWTGESMVPEYRVKCDHVPRRAVLELVIAIVAPNPMINGQFPPQPIGQPRAPQWVRVRGSYQYLNHSFSIDKQSLE